MFNKKEKALKKPWQQNKAITRHSGLNTPQPVWKAKVLTHNYCTDCLYSIRLDEETQMPEHYTAREESKKCRLTKVHFEVFIQHFERRTKRVTVQMTLSVELALQNLKLESNL